MCAHSEMQPAVSPEAPRRSDCPRSIGGFSLIEVLVTIVVIAIGLLGMAGLQSRLQVSEMESYQRAQALLLLNDITSRMSVNRRNAAAYIGNNVGEGECPGPGNVVQTDLSQWCNALRGAGETRGGSQLGAMIGGRGCVAGAGPNQFMITVAWQGLAASSAPPASVGCGAGAYDGGGGCEGDRCRRVVTTVVQFAPL